MNRILPILAGLALTLLFSACQTNNRQLGTLAGAGAGALAGVVAGNNVDGINKTEGAVAGAVVGGVLGNIAGGQQDQMNGMREEIRANTETVINVPNSNGSVTPVRIIKTPVGWQGPRGEVYNAFPTETQLAQAYGF